MHGPASGLLGLRVRPIDPGWFGLVRKTMVSVGVVANPASGRDVRRLVTGASVFDNAEKGAMIHRLMAGLGAAGVDPDRDADPLRRFGVDPAHLLDAFGGP